MVIYDSNQNNLTWINNDTIWMRRINLRGYTFNVGYKENHPFEYFDEVTLEMVLKILVAQLIKLKGKLPQ